MPLTHNKKYKDSMTTCQMAFDDMVKVIIKEIQVLLARNVYKMVNNIKIKNTDEIADLYENTFLNG